MVLQATGLIFVSDYHAISYSLAAETALAKVPLVIEYAAEILDGGVRKIVIFAHHRDVIAQLAEGLSKFKPVTLTGATSPQARQESIDAFQDDLSVRLFIGNIQAAGTGITLTVVPVAYLRNFPGFPPNLVKPRTGFTGLALRIR